MQIFTDLAIKKTELLPAATGNSYYYEPDLTRARFSTDQGTVLERNVEDYNELKIVPWNKITDRLNVYFNDYDYDEGHTIAAFQEMSLGTDQDDMSMTITIAHEAIHQFNFDWNNIDWKNHKALGLHCKSYYDKDETQALYISAITNIVLALWHDYKHRYLNQDWAKNSLVYTQEDYDKTFSAEIEVC